MGTSSSSNGPGKGVPMVPPWVPDAPADGDGDEPADDQPVSPDTSQTPPAPLPPVPLVAPPSRFNAARRNLGKFASSGKSESLKRGVGHYFKKGYGGGGTAVKRFGGTARTAGSLF